MVHYGFITQNQADVASNFQHHIRPIHRRNVSYSYAMDAIRIELNRVLEEHNIQLGGLKIYTTIDASLQQKAEESIDRNLRAVERLPGYSHPTRASFMNQSNNKPQNPNYIQGAVVCIENASGAVLSVVGGRDANQSQFNRALYAKRQIGSIFKPFVYLAAFNQGMQPGQYISDLRIKPGEIDRAQPSWSPANSSGRYQSIITAQQALAQSKNTSSVRVGDSAGLESIQTLAAKAGFDRSVPNTPSAFLGAFESTPWDVAAAYTIFPNGGVKYRPYLIEKIVDRDGNIVYPGSGQIPYVVSSPGATWNVSNTLREVVQTGTASALASKHQFNFDAGAKTGTTDNYKDAWFAGFTSSITCVVWVGLDTPKRTINRGYGSTLAMPIWADVVNYASRHGYRAQSLAPQFPFQSATLCRITSQHATQGCQHRQLAYRAQVPVDENPKYTCDRHPSKAQVITPNRQPARAIPVE